MVVHSTVAAALLGMWFITATASPPKILRYKYKTSVIAWIDESAAFESSGRLRDDLRSHLLQSNISANASGTCSTYIHASPMEHFAPQGTLEQATTASLAVLSGEVVSTSLGFWHGFPGTLVGFRVTDKFRPRTDGKPIPAAVGRIAYTFVPGAEFATPDGAICASAPQSVTVPSRGDTILLFSYLYPSDEADLVIPIDSRRHLVIRGPDRAFTPKKLAPELADLTVSAAMARIRQVSQGRRSQP